MDYILDTHVILWSMFESAKLSQSVQEILVDRKCRRFRGYGVLAIDQQHIEIYNTLPLLHRDPFDGIVVATALFEDMTIITADDNIQRYDVSWVW